jgi:peptide/nickel transport system substrate-binding protein
MQIFISYSSKDRELVKGLADDLELLGHEVWFDSELLRTGGQKWWATILTNLRQCDLFIFALTPNSLASDACQREYRYAYALHKRILPLMLAPVDVPTLPPELQEIQFANYTTQSRQQVAALGGSLNSLPPAQPLPDPLPPEPAVPLSPLARLAQQIEAPTLTSTEQIEITFELESLYREATTRASAETLIRKLNQRDDLTRTVANRLHILIPNIHKITKPRPAPKPPRERPVPSRMLVGLGLSGIIVLLLIVGIAAVINQMSNQAASSPTPVVSAPTKTAPIPTATAEQKQVSPTAAPTKAPTKVPTKLPTTVPPSRVPTTVLPPTALPTKASSAGTTSNGLRVDCSYGGEFEAIEKVDDLTFKVTLCYPDPAFLSKIALPAMAIHSAAQLTKTGGTGDLLTNPIGTGPYTLAGWTRGDQINLTPNDRYRGTAPSIKTVTIKWSSELTNRMNTLLTGNADGADFSAREDISTLKTKSNLKVYPRKPTNIFFLGMNNKIKPFDKLLVRQALAHAIDKQAIIDSFYPNGATIADQFVPPGVFGYVQYPTKNDYNPTLAKRLLAESGVVLPIKTTLTYRPVVRDYLPQVDGVALMIQQQLSEVGINAEVVVTESAAYFGDLSAGSLPLYFYGWLADYGDATNFLDSFFGKSASAQFGDINVQLAGKIYDAGKMIDPSARLRQYQEINTLLEESVPAIPVAFTGSYGVFAASVTGAYADPNIPTQFAALNNGADHFVWLQSGEPKSLYCNDETDSFSPTICAQINETLVTYDPRTNEIIPLLAKSWDINGPGTEWTFHLQDNVTFSDGTPLTSDDVITTWVAMWDAANPLHTGSTGSFDYFSVLFGKSAHKPQ